MDDKKVTQSITLVAGFLTMLVQSLIGFDVLPAEGEGPAGGIVTNLAELSRNVFALVTVYGLRRKLGEQASA